MIEYKNKDWLMQKYFVEKLSLREIANICHTNPVNIRYYANKFDLKLRTTSEALKGKTLSDTRKKKQSEISKEMWKNPNYRQKILKNLSKPKKGFENPRFGKPLSEETKEKIRQKHLGKTMSVESKQKMSDAAIKRFNNKPENHPLFGTRRLDITGVNHHKWNNGITPLYKKIREYSLYKTWRQECFIRDNFTCRFCNKPGKEKMLQVDHIKPYALIIKENNLKTPEQALQCKELWDLDNGRTLCIECHRTTDTYGKSVAKYLKEIKE